MAKSLADLKLLPKAQIQKINKDDIIDIIIAAKESGDGSLSRVEERLDALFHEMSALRQTVSNFEDSSKKKLQEMQAKLDKQADIIMAHQMFLENIDRKGREDHLIVFGVPEDQEALDGATSDISKLDKIWTTIESDVIRVSDKRLGKTAVTGKKRPILVVVRSKDDRDKVLDQAKKLSDAGNLYERIYVKKDQHPEVRKEWNRLREAEKRERLRPENQNATIRLDTKERKLYINDIVIDSWSPHPF